MFDRPIVVAGLILYARVLREKCFYFGLCYLSLSRCFDKLSVGQIRGARMGISAVVLLRSFAEVQRNLAFN